MEILVELEILILLQHMELMALVVGPLEKAMELMALVGPLKKAMELMVELVLIQLQAIELMVEEVQVILLKAMELMVQLVAMAMKVM